ncbi:MAG TPA: hypothetical protein P5514_13715 [Bacteroidales bacterium]|nr:hypothetical protein [Bacteroidales bacterium]HRX98000.1 hypothetical protein [Bacteroidales bacterium]
MKNLIIHTIIGIAFTLFFVSCAEKEKVDLTKAPIEIKNAIEKSYNLSEKLTDIQVKAGEDKNLDNQETEQIGELFRELAIVNNINLKNYSTDKYYIALKKEYKPKFDSLAAKVTFLKDCKGYDEMGLAIQKIALEVRDVTELPMPKQEIISDTTLIKESM